MAEAVKVSEARQMVVADACGNYSTRDEVPVPKLLSATVTRVTRGSGRS
ncbi:MAG: hypothetical protein ACP5PQ_04300 [Thermoproteota archaeon]